MLYYVFVFAAAVMCCYFSERTQRKGLKKTAIILKIMAVVLPAALAGLRSTNVGTDVKFYLIDDYNLAVRSNDIGSYLKDGYGEPLFLALVYVVSKLFRNINVLLFVIELFVSLFIYLGCEKFKKTVPIYLSYAFFLFVYYNMSLNLLRQSIALAISFFALKYMLDKKRVKFLVTVVIAFMFHRTALLMLIVWALYEITSSVKNKYLAYFSCSLVVGMFVLFFKKIVEFFVWLSLLDSKYLYYTQSGDVDISLTYIGFSLVLLAVVLIARKKITRKNSENSFLIFMCILNVILLTLSLQYNTAERFTYYFGYANLILIPTAILPYGNEAVLSLKHSVKGANKRKQSGRLIAALVAYFLMITSFHVVYYGILGNHRTYPCESEVLNVRSEND